MVKKYKVILSLLLLVLCFHNVQASHSGIVNIEADHALVKTEIVRPIDQLSLQQLVSKMKLIRCFSYLDKLKPKVVALDDNFMNICRIFDKIQSFGLIETLENIPSTIPLVGIQNVFVSEYLRFLSNHARRSGTRVSEGTMIELANEHPARLLFSSWPENQVILQIDFLKMKIRELLENATEIAYKFSCAKGDRDERQRLDAFLKEEKHTLFSLMGQLRSLLGALITEHGLLKIQIIEKLAAKLSNKSGEPAKSKFVEVVHKKKKKGDNSKKTTPSGDAHYEKFGIQREEINQQLRQLALYINCSSALEMPLKLTICRMKPKTVQTLWKYLDIEESVRKLVTGTMGHVLALERSEFEILMHDYLLEPDGGKRWEVIAACYLSNTLAKGPLHIIGINKHRLSQKSGDSREFDIILENKGVELLCECKDVEWQWLMHSSDEDAIERRIEILKQLSLQKLIAQELHSPFLLLCGKEFPEDIPIDFQRVLEGIVCIHSKQYTNPYGIDFTELYNKEGSYSFLDRKSH